MKGRFRLSVVAPVYNEEACLGEFYRRLAAALGSCAPEAEIVFVNDGSTDGSLAILRGLKASDPRVKILDFSRNFGHQIAVKAGIDFAKGDRVVILDADLQDPPETIPDFIAKSTEGYDVVYAVRAKREGEGFFKKWTAAGYYRLMKKIAHIDLPLDTGDFRLITRPVADTLKNIRERNLYLRGLMSWVGFRQTGIPIRREARFAGRTKYSLAKMWNLAWNGIVHFSFLPLQLSTFLGIIACLISLVWIVQALYVSLVLKIAVPGWTSLMTAVLFLGSVQLMTLGILGSYLGRSFDEARGRPLYILQGKEGFDGDNG